MDRAGGIVDVGDVLVEEADQAAHQPALGLALFAQEEQVVAGDQGEVDLGNDRVVVADDAGEQLLALAEHAQEVVADLLLDGLGNPAAGPQVFEVGSVESWLTLPWCLRRKDGSLVWVVDRSCTVHPFIVGERATRTHFPLARAALSQRWSQASRSFRTCAAMSSAGCRQLDLPKRSKMEAVPISEAGKTIDCAVSSPRGMGFSDMPGSRLAPKPPLERWRGTGSDYSSSSSSR